VDDGVIDEVGALLREAAATAVLPVFQRLDAAEIEEKAPGEVVTVADRQAEQIIGAGLLRLLPGSVVVGEEAVSAEPAILDRLRSTGAVWLVDPIDGTANFADGRRPFVMMVALLRDGAIEASWILDPIEDTLTVAELGSGTYQDGVKQRTTPDALPAAALRGVVMRRFLPSPLRGSVSGGEGQLGELLPGLHCAGREYLDIVCGVQHFALFWRTLPWDHAPGALLVREAGGMACRLDGGEYDPADEQSGLLVAANEQIWHTVRAALL
jgi:fructose-1,6-bisphosphatase/inositol monophosphatase family enzyme